MSSKYPSSDQEKRGVRKTIRKGVKWFKDVKDAVNLKRPSSAPPSSTNLEGLAAPSIGSQNATLSRPITPLLAPAPLPAEPEVDRVITPPGPSIEASVPDAEVDNAREHKKYENTGSNRLMGALRALESCVELFPPLKSAVGALIRSLDTVQRAASNHTDYEELADEFELLAQMVKQYAGELESEPDNGSIANIAQCIQRQVTDIERKEASGTVGRLWDATENQADVIRRYRQVERLFRQIQHDLSMRTRSEVKKQLETTLLRGMFPVDDARYNSVYSTTIRRRACTEKTREAIHQTLREWTTNPTSEKIYWMNGMAGTGKTTIAYSFCEWLEETNQLGASFFCSRISSTCRSLNHIVPTLAYQLARFSPGFRSSLCRILNDNPDAGKLNVVQQFEKLVNQPMINAKKAMPDSVVVLIDALDECDDNYSVRLLLDLLLKFAQHLPLKFFVSSRPEPLIRERMMSQGGASRSIVYLHDIEEPIVEEDIKKYLTESLRSMIPSPPPEQIEMLAKRSRNLFIYAATLVRYIYPEDIHVDSNSRLRSMLATISDPRAIAENKYEDLDRLYTTVLKAVFNKRLDKNEKQRMQGVLWTVVCAREPMTSATIASLASLDEEQVWAALQVLRSVVHVPEDRSLISTLHASFPEYMLDRSRSKGFHCNESNANETLALRCFDSMRSGLRFNICELESSYLTDDQVDNLDARIARHISPTLSYACRYWTSHLRVAPARESTRTMLFDLLSNQLLFWMEVLSLCRCIGIGAPMMQQAQAWLQMKNNNDDGQKQVSDARNFVTWFAANPCSRSTPHIYISALPLCAKSSWVYQHYFQRTTGLIDLSISQHEEAVLAIWSLESAGHSVAISPDGDRIASGNRDGSVQVYDINTGAIVAGPFQEHSRVVLSVAFSPDGRHIASGSQDETVIVWEAYTGRIVAGPLEDYVHTAWSVHFSPDGRRLVSGSDDGTIIVWDTYTGKIALGPLEAHTHWITSVAFSPNGQLIASGSEDQTIQLWNASTGAAVAEPLRGHTGSVNMVAFSPVDGSKLASCSHDKTIRVWDIKAGTIIGSPFTGHRDGVCSMAFSHDGSWIVSGGEREDNNIIVWETLTGSIVLGPLSGHTTIVRSVVFTPDNTRIVSCSDDSTVRIWDVQPENKALGQTSARELCVGPIAFLRNRTRFISRSSSGNALKIWDICTGMTASHEFEGQSEGPMLHFITASPQDTLVAASADDSTIRVWSILTGKLVCQPLRGHNSPIRCLDFSLDGSQLCSGSNDATVAVWDIDTGVMVGQSYTGHTGAVMSVAFSPDAAYIVSSSADFTIMIWDTSIGTLVHTLAGHNNSVSSVAFSANGNHIVTGSVDGSIRQWDLRAGTPFSSTYAPDSDSDSDSDSEPDLSSSSDRFSSINCVCFSSDGTRIITGFGSSLRLVDAHTMVLISRISLPQGEKVRWVGYSSDGMDIISVSTSEEAGTQGASDDYTYQSAQSPNFVRVWRANARPDPMDSSSTHSWSYEPDGRVMSPRGLVMWIPPNLIPHIEAHTKLGSESHYSSLVMSSDKFIHISYRDLCIGNRWTECYVSP
ncbi:vegetative incompatibility protein HET-E-1 [Rhizoctonia solani AG-3 Rhs1AP]|uniref:Vegetative incompatibility protein HET-E-1 n=1 Tax=Rhizoctonia solani AG-3 Rhs1AP TaxID=1086054 RepID=A0A0A1UJJ3_9AGAM|nr:vegetative incompatibility protein HET-E-1 [Rhizoctonia solani AG-3 Rhs1AP]